MDPRGFPTALPEFQRVFPDDGACGRYLEKLRWPDGFGCPKCRWTGEPYRFAARAGVLRCRGCQGNISLTAGTVMQSSHTPLSTWFWGAYLVTTQTPGMSALQFQRQLGIKTYETAWQLLHKLRSGLVRPERDAIGGKHAVEVDECYVGGATRGEGRGVHHKTTVVGAVEVRERALDGVVKNAVAKALGKKGKRGVYAGRLRLRVVSGIPSILEALADPITALSGRGSEELTTFVKENVAPGSRVRTDGWIGYAGLKAMGYDHDALPLNGDTQKAEKHLPMIHLVFSNLKTWIQGTHHGRIHPKHLQAYLNEYVFRFNRRFYPMTTFNSALGLAVRVVPPTYDQLYSGEWVHPTGAAMPSETEVA